MTAVVVLPKQKLITWGLIWDLQNLNLENDHSIDSFNKLDWETSLEIEIEQLIAKQETENCEELDLTITELFLDQETENYDRVDSEISKLITDITQREEKEGKQIQKEDSNKLSKSPCASPLMPYLDEVSGILSSVGRNFRSDGSNSRNKSLDEEMEFQSPTVGSSTEIAESKSESSTVRDSTKTPIDESLGKLPCIAPCVKLSQAGQSQINISAILSLLVTIPVSPPALLSLNVMPVNLPNRGIVPRLPAPITVNHDANSIPIQTGNAPIPLLQLNVFPTPKIVNKLFQLKQKKLKGPMKRLTHKTPKT